MGSWMTTQLLHKMKSWLSVFVSSKGARSFPGNASFRGIWHRKRDCVTTGNNIKKTVSNVSLHFVPSLQSAVCILYLVCILYPVCRLQSAVCSLHFVLTDERNLFSVKTKSWQSQNNDRKSIQTLSMRINKNITLITYQETVLWVFHWWLCTKTFVQQALVLIPPSRANSSLAIFKISAQWPILSVTVCRDYLQTSSQPFAKGQRALGSRSPRSHGVTLWKRGNKNTKYWKHGLGNADIFYIKKEYTEMQTWISESKTQ